MQASIWNGIKFRSCRLPSTKDEHCKYRVGVDALPGIADAYWGNGMRLAIGEKLGVAKLHLDLRRGDGPPDARFIILRP